MALNQFDASTSRRLSLTLLASTGALLFKAIDLVGAARIAGEMTYAEQIAGSLVPLSMGFMTALVAFALVEIAAHPDTPATGLPHSLPYFLRWAFALIVFSGGFCLPVGGFILLVTVTTASLAT